MWVTPVVTLAYGDQPLAHAEVYHLGKEGRKAKGCIPLHMAKNIAVPLDPTNYSEAALRYQENNLSIEVNAC